MTAIVGMAAAYATDWAMTPAARPTLSFASMNRPSARALDVAAAVAAVVGVGLLLVALMVLVNGAGYGYDYAAYDAAARRIVAGEPLYIADTAARYARGEYEGLYLYPPPVALWLAPLALLATSSATAVWLVLRVALLVVGCWLLPVDRRARLLTLAVAGISFPVWFDLNLGNVSVVTFALAALAWRTLDSPIAAVAHAALIAIRFPFALFFVEWAVERRWRTILWTIVAGLALIVISLPIVGVGTYVDYVTILRSLPDISTGQHNLSLKTTGLEIGLPESTASLASLVGYVAGAAAVVYAGLRRDRDTAFVVTATATLLVAPFIHPHYLVLLLLPAALLVARGQWWGLLLPLAGWLPDSVLPLAAPVAIGAVLLARRADVAADLAPLPRTTPVAS